VPRQGFPISARRAALRGWAGLLPSNEGSIEICQCGDGRHISGLRVMVTSNRALSMRQQRICVKNMNCVHGPRRTNTTRKDQTRVTKRRPRYWARRLRWASTPRVLTALAARDPAAACRSGLPPAFDGYRLVHRRTCIWRRKNDDRLPELVARSGPEPDLRSRSREISSPAAVDPAPLHR
jgi:hypothetical protein